MSAFLSEDFSAGNFLALAYHDAAVRSSVHPLVESVPIEKEKEREGKKGKKGMLWAEIERGGRKERAWEAERGREAEKERTRRKRTRWGWRTHHIHGNESGSQKRRKVIEKRGWCPCEKKE